MWLYIVAIALLVVGVIGSIFSGGIFTIIVLPLGVVVLAAGIVTAMWARSSGARNGEKDVSRNESRPLPHTNRPQPGTSGSNSPEELVDARGRAQ